MDEGSTNNPNETPSSHSTKFWGLLAMVAPTAHITQQTFLIGLFPEIKFSLVKMMSSIPPSPYDLSLCIFHHTSLTHIYMSHISHFVEEASSIQCSRQRMMEKEHKMQHVPIF